jgi:hypothetical protein
MAAWEKLITFEHASLVTARDGAVIPDGSLQTAQHCLLENAVLETAPSRTQKYTQIESGAQVDGIHRSFDTLANVDTLVACNGKIKYDTGSAFSDLQTGLTAGYAVDFLNYGDRTLIVNGQDDAYEFYPRTNAIQKAGLEPPRFYKKVAYFETDETFTDGDADTSIYDITERTGISRRSMKVTATAGATQSAYVTFSSAQDFSQFSNGKSVTDNDFICVSIFHRIRSYIVQMAEDGTTSGLSIDFWTSAGNYYRALIDPDELDEVLLRDNQWTYLKIKRSRFTDGTGSGIGQGTGNWASVSRVYFNVTAVTGSAIVNFDNIYIKNAPMVVVPYGKIIDNFESSFSTWTVTNGSLKDNHKYKRIKQGLQSLKFIRSGTPSTIYKDVAAINLEEYIDGVASPTSDEISFWVYSPSTAYLTSIEVRLYSDTSTPEYFSYTFTKTSDEIPRTISGAWFELSKSRATYEIAKLNTPDWSAITRIYFGIITTGTCTLFFDDWKMREATTEKEIRTMETSETWTYSSGATAGFSSEPRYRVKGDRSYYVKVPVKKSYYVQSLVDIDLSIFGTGETSSTDDVISWWMYWTVFGTIKKIEIFLDCNAADFSTDYFTYVIERPYLRDLLMIYGQNSMDDRGTYISIKKSDFERHGSTAAKGWDTIKGAKFLVTGINADGNPVKIYFDDLHMRRERGITGLYQWCAVFFDSNLEPSGASEWSEEVTISGTRALLTQIPTSQDSKAIGRWIFRKGGDLGNEARRDITLWDNSTTSYFADLQDYQTETFLLTDESIPKGTIRFPKAAKFGPSYNDRVVLYRDPDHLNRFYWSNSGFPCAFSEDQALDFSSELLDCWIDNDQYFFNTKDGIYRTTDDFSDLVSRGIEYVGISKSSIAPLASAQVDDIRAFVADDGVYLFSSQAPIYISEEVKTYFDSASYDLDAVIMSPYHKRHLYISVKTTGGTRSLLDLYVPTRQWSTKPYSYTAFCIFDGPGDNGELYAGSSDGYVYQMGTGYEEMTVVTKDYPVSTVNPYLETTLENIWVKARSDSATPGSVNIQFRMDQTLNGSITVSFPSTGNLTSTFQTYWVQLVGVYNYLKGSKVGISITQSTSDKHVEIESIFIQGSAAALPKILEE